MRAAPAGAIVAAAALALTGCSRTSRDVRATVLDEAGNPVPGAVFYAEIYDEGGPIAFTSLPVGSAGGVPEDARQALHVPWREGARIALAAFAPGYRPTVLRDPAGRIRADGAVLVLRPAAAAGAWEPAVAELGFPFPDDPLLAAEAAGPAHAPLREALRITWAARRAAAEPLTDADERKFSTISAME